MALGVMTNAQVRTCDIPNDADNIWTLPLDPTTAGSLSFSYDGAVEDTLTINQDTLLLYVSVNKPFPVNYYTRTVLDTIAGADTTVVINVYGKMLAGDSYSLIETATTSAITGEIATIVESMTDPDYALTFAADSTYTITPSIKPYYNYLKFEFIIKGNDSVGEGIKLESFDLYIKEAR